ncbi:hypothetical protein E2C01_079067 [Portunus trituberculatus]|uniref:Uncharacterized protein n=1 Tax=Portunus trituberculatus TaxID=210409 RepID=A0A5B7IIP6_PORTR|nr:hypothetical protein [Portunus trituberculatus]
MRRTTGSSGYNTYRLGGHITLCSAVRCGRPAGLVWMWRSFLDTSSPPKKRLVAVHGDTALTLQPHVERSSTVEREEQERPGMRGLGGRACVSRYSGGRHMTARAAGIRWYFELLTTINLAYYYPKGAVKQFIN